jgi:hypothetical protein
VRSMGEESSTRVLPDLSLFNITLTPTLKGEIIAAQKSDAGMAHIKRRIQEGDPKVACFREDAEGTLWFNAILLCEAASNYSGFELVNRTIIILFYSEDPLAAENILTRRLEN